MDFDYPIHYINDRTFEKVVGLICQKVLGTGTIIFADRNDGGRDARFEGTAQKYPSEASQWQGKFIIQTKHTSNPTGKCSDGDFRREVTNEVAKILKLVESNEIDNYLLFTNRVLTGDEDALIRKQVIDGTKIKKCAAIGKETINMWLNEYPDIADLAGITKYLLPITFYEEDFKNLILFFSKNKTEIASEAVDKQNDLIRVSLDEKNAKNKLSEAYFKFMLDRSLVYFKQIDDFLKDPKNKELLKAYEATVIELNSKILTNRNQFNAFEEIFDHLYNFILKNNSAELKTERKLIYIFLDYMYYNCDIGEK